ncbi:MAG TPA: hypothetical protein VFC63_04220, partial [Blastocatellia bacterium]|nr:hypothetical protein [Blastocatellia bacterium]
MNRSRIHLSPTVVVSGVALLVALVSVVSSLTRRIGLVEPHVWIKTTATEKESVQTLSRARALENTMSGEVSHMAIRL